jgi:trimeric autotransporter adhesin
MNTLTRSTLGLISAFALAGTAFAQVPASNDKTTTDGNFNTGGGSGALSGSSLTGGQNVAYGFNALSSNTGGQLNAAFGFQALYSNTTGGYNTAAGFDALFSNTGGYANTASGYRALNDNTTGYDNTASGSGALFYNTNGYNNTASGFYALLSNTTGYNNTAAGSYALQSNTTGYDNTAAGENALADNTTGDYNTAAGFYALFSNANGNYNNASGYYSLHSNTSGSQNSASGVQALYGNKTGNFNTASGTDALFSNTTGSTNIAEGYKAGYNLTTGSNNIDIGNFGAAAESSTIRIGTTSTQTKIFIAGIYGTSVTGSAVAVSSTGQLGVTVSSERFKTAIVPMGSDTARLEQLRPVSFRLKSDAKGTRQYGLIAEEVAKVYPELVLRDEKGRIDGVRYDELAPMLLNEMQKKNAAQDAKILALERQMADMHAALLKLQTKGERTAQR